MSKIFPYCSSNVVLPPNNLTELFQVIETPWCEDGLSAETNVLSETLAKYNALGVLTINSQPNVNGVSSLHPVFGWGDKGGYIFQKVGLLFCFLVIFISS